MKKLVFSLAISLGFCSTFAHAAPLANIQNAPWTPNEHDWNLIFNIDNEISKKAKESISTFSVDLEKKLNGKTRIFSKIPFSQKTTNQNSPSDLQLNDFQVGVRSELLREYQLNLYTPQLVGEFRTTLPPGNRLHTIQNLNYDNRLTHGRISGTGGLYAVKRFEIFDLISRLELSAYLPARYVTSSSRAFEAGWVFSAKSTIGLNWVPKSTRFRAGIEAGPTFFSSQPIINEKLIRYQPDWTGKFLGSIDLLKNVSLVGYFKTTTQSTETIGANFLFDLD